jgi:hypothetical protein
MNKLTYILRLKSISISKERYRSLYKLHDSALQVYNGYAYRSQCHHPTAYLVKYHFALYRG